MQFAFKITLTDKDAATTVNLDLPVGLYGLTYFGFEFTTGSGATIQPVISEDAAAPAGGGDEEDRYAPAAATAKATPIQTQFDPPIPFNVVANPASARGGRLYFRPHFNASADNDGVGLIVFTPLGPQAEVLSV